MTISADKAQAREAARQGDGTFGEQSLPEPAGLTVVQPEPVLKTRMGRPVTLMDAALIGDLWTERWRSPEHKLHRTARGWEHTTEAQAADAARLGQVRSALDALVDPDATVPDFRPTITGSQFVRVLRDTYPSVPESTVLEAAQLIGYCAARQREFAASARQGGHVGETFASDRPIDVTLDEARNHWLCEVDDDVDFPSNEYGRPYDPDRVDVAFADLYERRWRDMASWLADVDDATSGQVGGPR